MTPTDASREPVDAARRAVRELLQHSRAFNALAEDKRRQLTHDLMQIGSYLAAPDGIRRQQQNAPVRADTFLAGVDFPDFVSELIQGVFAAIVGGTIRQMEAYADLVANVAKSVDKFRDENITDDQARDYLIAQFPDFFEPRPGGNRSGYHATAAVSAALTRLATSRQQLLATMVLMGVNRIARCA